jgi:PAS domain S-box-containing protein
MQKKNSIFNKLYFLHTVSTAILFVVILVSYYYIEKNNFARQLIQRTRLIHDILTISCVDPVVNMLAYDRTAQVINTLYKANKDIVSIEIYDPTARIVASIGAKTDKPFSMDDITDLFKQKSDSLEYIQKKDGNIQLITRLVKEDQSNNIIYLGLIRINITKENLRNEFKRNILFFLGVFITAVTLTSMIFFLFTNKWITNPVTAVSNIMKRYGKSDLASTNKNIKEYNKKIEDNEIGIMSLAFEQMISSILKTQQRLREREKDIRITLDSIGDAVIATDASCNIVRMNPVAEHLTGWNFFDARGKPLISVFNIVNANTGAVVENPAEKVLKTGKIEGVASHTMLVSKDGQRYQIADSGAPIRDDDDQISGVVIVFRDVTQKYKLQNQLIQSQKMEAIGTLAAGIAHDFNNILSGVFGFSQLANNHINDPERAKKDIEQIVTCAKRATELVQQILTFSRQSEHKKSLLNVSPILKETLKLLKSSLPSNIIIEEQIFSKSLIMADPTHIHQIIMNICTNAWHSMSEKGNVMLVKLEDIENFKPGEDLKKGNYLKLTIADEGHGIDDETIKKIFDPYFTTKEVGKGTGLGLALVNEIVKEYKGCIKVASNLDHGTVFNIFLPIASKDSV